jgi:hypothetical protein
MSDFLIPHLPPIRFVKSLLFADEKSASVEVGFQSIPSIGMLIEAAAQSSSGVKDSSSDVKVGFLITLKNIKLLQELQSTKFRIDIDLDHKLENFKSLSFKIFENNTKIATGSFAVALQ